MLSNNELSNENESKFREMNHEIIHISNNSGGYISANKIVFEKIPNSYLSRQILKEATKGTPIIKFGSKNPKIMLIAGIHGNELPPQIAILHLINKLKKSVFKGTIYIIPFSAPKATMNNSRWFEKSDLNRIATKDGSVSNSILKKIKELNVESVADFHSTAPNSNPGKEGIFCTSNPSPKSVSIAEYIAKSTKSEALKTMSAGGAYEGAIEDESNMLGIPAVTCEVLSPNGIGNESACLRSIAQMEAYLSYFGIQL